MSFGGGPGGLTTELGFGNALEETQVEVGQQFGTTPTRAAEAAPHAIMAKPA
jgi:hypothetical protein